MSIQYNEAMQLKKLWGDKPCNHRNLEKENYRGTATGDWVFTKCGEAGPGRDWPIKEKHESRKQMVTKDCFIDGDI